MKIAVDLDEVLADIIGPLTSYHNMNYGTSYKPDDYINYGLTEIWKVNSDEALKRLYKFYRSPEFDLLRPVPGAVSTLQELSGKHSLYIITSRPQEFHHKTVAWLNTHVPNTFTDIISTDQVAQGDRTKRTKSTVCLEIGAELIIEDHIDYALDCASKGIQVLLYERPWNRNYKLGKNIQRVRSWGDINSYILQLT